MDRSTRILLPYALLGGAMVSLALPLMASAEEAVSADGRSLADHPYALVADAAEG